MGKTTKEVTMQKIKNALAWIKDNTKPLVIGFIIGLIAAALLATGAPDIVSAGGELVINELSVV